MIEILRRIVKAHGRASLQAEGRVARLDGPRIARTKGDSGSASLRFGQDVPLSVEVEQALARYADYWEARSEAQTPGEHRRAKTRAILRERGVDPTAVAFIYCSTTDIVRRLRGRHGLDPDTGLGRSARKGERIDGKRTVSTPLTVSGRDEVIGALQRMGAEDVRNPSAS